MGRLPLGMLDFASLSPTYAGYVDSKLCGPYVICKWWGGIWEARCFQDSGGHRSTIDQAQVIV